jgi:hypothetical protein
VLVCEGLLEREDLVEVGDEGALESALNMAMVREGSSMRVAWILTGGGGGVLLMKVLKSGGGIKFTVSCESGSGGSDGNGWKR